MKQIIGLCLLLILYIAAFPQKSNLTSQQYKEDFEFLWKTIQSDYCYFDKKQTDWLKVKEYYQPQFDSIKNRNEFISLIENVIYELYDDHVGINKNIPNSFRLVPTSSDLYVEWVNNKAIIKEVRKGFIADKADIKAGMEIVEINGVLIQDAINSILPKCLKRKDIEADNWSLRKLLAGKHNEPRVIKIKYNNDLKIVELDKAIGGVVDSFYKSALSYNSKIVEAQILEKNIGYIRINNSLSDNKLIAKFDSVLNNLKNTDGLILDLRETPSGGNNTIACGILGRLVNKETPYQKYLFPNTGSADGTRITVGSLDLIVPRGEFIYTKPMNVLVSHWTGSMGEGIAVGLDGIKRATIIGTEMARLNGGSEGSVELPNSKISVNIITTKIYHINGLPRELYKPNILVDFIKEKSTKSNDLVLEKALIFLKQKIKK